MKRIEQLYCNQHKSLNGGRISNIRNCPGSIFEELTRGRMSDMFFATVLGEHQIGIELEYENCLYTPNRCPSWTVKLDGSLRNDGLEFVSRNIQMVSVEKALKEVENLINSLPTTNFTTGIRTSVHIHHNIRRRTLSELRSFFALYLLFERSLFNLAGPNRVDSRFCVPVNFTLNTGSKHIEDFIKEFPKYSALGLYRTPDLGTIEFRAHEGSKDFQRIMKWITVGYMLLYTARVNSSKIINDWVQAYSTGKLSLSELQTKVFSPIVFPIDSSWDEVAIPNSLIMLSLLT